MSVLGRFPENRLARSLLAVLWTFVYLSRALFGTLTGVFILSAGVYLTAENALGVKPWAHTDLLLWFDALNPESKVAIATAVMTIVGFFVALHTTMEAWRRQTAVSLRMEAADRIDETLTDLMQTVLEVQLFAESVSTEVARVRKDRIPFESARLLTPLSEDVAAFRTNRDKFFRLASELGRMSARYSTLFLPVRGAKEALESAEGELDTLRKSIRVRVPRGGGSTLDDRRELAEVVDPTALQALARVCEVVRDRVSGLQGGVRGGLCTAPSLS